ncbi:MAG: type II toxin-antitoxin system VapC family toxin [Candidatus Saccharimonas sp.]|nr:type II toxin-antitoxin system VapC family toxin [Planctomycetaceae bacterium]
MIVLDSDHISVLQHEDSPLAEPLLIRLEQSLTEVVVTAITLEEQCRGWLAEIHRRAAGQAQVPYYARLVQLFDFFASWRVLPFDQRAAVEFERLRQQHRRMGVMDLKIAAIALVQDATLISRNLRDFEVIAELHVEDWLTGS